MCLACASHPELVDECRRSRAEAVARTYLFQGLSADALEQVLRGAEEIEVGGGDWLFFQEEAAESFYLLLDGDVALSRLSSDGGEVIVAIVGPGELFEEDLLLLDDPRHGVSARPLGDCRLVRFGQRRTRPLLSREPSLIPKLAGTLQRRNKLLLEEVERLSVADASQRLIRYLESQPATSGDGRPLRFPKRVLASRLSIRPETLSRVLKRLKGCGLIQEADGALVLRRQPVTAGSPCEDCPARSWGCPGPGRVEATRQPAAATTPGAASLRP